MATIAATVAPERDASAELRRALKRSGRREQLRAAALVLPLFLFLLASFIVPIGAMLARGVVDSDIAHILPRVSAELRQWDGRDLPPDTAFAAMVDDLRAARAAGTLASAATRLNYDVAGFRTLLFAAGRRVSDEPIAAPRQALVEIDPKWGERETWAAIRRAGGPVTAFYLLAALDLRRDADNAIVPAPAQESIFRDVLARTLWISAVVTLACLLLGYPVALFIARQPPQRASLLLCLVLLPFMVLPLYAVMKSVPPSYERAAASLGAAPFTAFRRVYLPQTLPGIAAGCLIVFIQALGYYITPALVGGAEDQMISYFIAFYASRTVNWGMAAALSIMLLVATLALYAVYNRMIGLGRMRMT